MPKHFTKIVLSAALGLFVHGAANAQDTVEVGRLDCAVEGGTGFVFGSSKDLRCTFEPSRGGAGEVYFGTIRKFGIDIGRTRESFIRWAVFAPSDAVGQGALSGSYGGVSAEVTAGLGLGANVLLGGSGDTIALQPLSVQTQRGVNVAATISRLDLANAN